MHNHSDTVAMAMASGATKVGMGATATSAVAQYTGWAGFLIKHGELISIAGVLIGVFCTMVGTGCSIYFKWRAARRGASSEK